MILMYLIMIILMCALFFIIGIVYGKPSYDEREKTLLKRKDIEKIIGGQLRLNKSDIK